MGMIKLTLTCKIYTFPSTELWVHMINVILSPELKSNEKYAFVLLVCYIRFIIFLSITNTLAESFFPFSQPQ